MYLYGIARFIFDKEHLYIKLMQDLDGFDHQRTLKPCTKNLTHSIVILGLKSSANIFCIFLLFTFN